MTHDTTTTEPTELAQAQTEVVELVTSLGVAYLIPTIGGTYGGSAKLFYTVFVQFEQNPLQQEQKTEAGLILTRPFAEKGTYSHVARILAAHPDSEYKPGYVVQVIDSATPIAPTVYRQVDSRYTGLSEPVFIVPENNIQAILGRTPTA